LATLRKDRIRPQEAADKIAAQRWGNDEISFAAGALRPCRNDPLYNGLSPIFSHSLVLLVPVAADPGFALAIYAADRVGKARNDRQAQLDRDDRFVFFFALVTVIGFMASRLESGRSRPAA